MDPPGRASPRGLCGGQGHRPSPAAADHVRPETIRAAIGTSQKEALAGLKALAEAGVVRQISEGSYDRQFAATELFDLVTACEARIAGRSGAS